MFCTVPVFETRLFISSLSFVPLSSSFYICSFILEILVEFYTMQIHAEAMYIMHKFSAIYSVPEAMNVISFCPSDGGLQACQGEGRADCWSTPSGKGPCKPNPQSTAIMAPTLSQEVKTLSDCRWTVILWQWCEDPCPYRRLLLRHLLTSKRDYSVICNNEYELMPLSESYTPLRTSIETRNEK